MVSQRWRVSAAAAAVAGYLVLWAGWFDVRPGAFFEPRSWLAAQALLGGLAWTLSGVVLWGREMTRRLGTIMVLAGVFIATSRLIDSANRLLFTLGSTLQWAVFPALLWAVLAYPSARLTIRLDRWVVAGIAITTTAYGVISSMFYDPALGWCEPCVPGMNLLLVRHMPALVDPLYAVHITLLGSAGAYAAVVLLRRWRTGTRLARRVRGPMLVPAIVYAVVIALFHFYELPGELGLVVLPIPLKQVGVVGWLAQTVLPVTFLVGLARAHARRGRVADLVTELRESPSTDRLEDALRRTLRDPSLELGYWSAVQEGYRTSEGGPLAIPDDRDRATTRIDGDGGPLAVLVHDPALLEDVRLLEATTAAVKLAVENARLAAELQDQLRHVRASRFRIIKAGDEARRRVERDLHDGAQQRLVSLSLLLRQARDSNGDGSTLLLEAGRELDAALAELRDLARGVYPLVLSEGGLAAGLDGLAERAPVATVLEEVVEERLPEGVETAAYFVASEALTNAAKHADASTVRIRARVRDHRLVIEVADDGRGGAFPAPGGGLAGLVDRVEALDGIVTIDSPPGVGTTIRAEMPCDW